MRRKKCFICALLTVVLTCCFFVLSSCDSNSEKGSEGLAYILSETNDYYKVRRMGLCSDYDIIIPSTYKGLPVKEIADYAFQEETSIKSITIPEGVTLIGDYAFAYCSSLTSVVIPDSVTTIVSYAFYSCSSLTCVYYKGTPSDWEKISIGFYGTLKSAPRYYYSEEPVATGNYWHYVNDVPTKW